MKLIIINGPNLNLLGKREPDIYGKEPFESYFQTLMVSFPGVQLDYFQSNVEGEIINKIHAVGFDYDGIILNAGGYTHTSISIADAVAAIRSPVVEVHISNIFSREEVRHQSMIAKYCIGFICGFGLESYRLAVEGFILHQQKKN